MATRSTRSKDLTRTNRPAASQERAQAPISDLLLLEELHANLPVGLLVNDADTLEVLHAKLPLPGLAVRDLPREQVPRSRQQDVDDSPLGPELASLVREVAATGTPQHLPEFRHEPPEREPRWWSASLHRVDTDRWGQVVVTLAVDLTDQVRARRLLAEREARHETLRQAIAAVPGRNLVLSLQQVTDALVPALPLLAINLLSGAHGQTSIHFHYTAGEIPILIAATVLGVAWLAGRRPGVTIPVIGVAIAATVIGNYKPPSP